MGARKFSQQTEITADYRKLETEVRNDKPKKNVGFVKE